MKLTSMAWVLAAAMCGASVAVVVAQPSSTAKQLGKEINLERDVPTEFADWTKLPAENQVRDPQAEKLLITIYSQILTRTYVNKDGYRIMLSMAYGDDQRGGLQAHRPEICYPAQGFTLNGLQDGALPTSFGDVPVRRLLTRMGSRNEPVTYWLAMADHVVRNQFDKRMVQFRLFLTGQIPDGLLFRVSSIDGDAARAFAMQQKFTADMLAAVPPATRRQLSGLDAPAGAT